MKNLIKIWAYVSMILFVCSDANAMLPRSVSAAASAALTCSVRQCAMVLNRSNSQSREGQSTVNMDTPIIKQFFESSYQFFSSNSAWNDPREKLAKCLTQAADKNCIDPEVARGESPYGRKENILMFACQEGLDVSIVVELIRKGAVCSEHVWFYLCQPRLIKNNGRPFVDRKSYVENKLKIARLFAAAGIHPSGSSPFRSVLKTSLSDSRELCNLVFELTAAEDRSTVCDEVLFGAYVTGDQAVNMLSYLFEKGVYPTENALRDFIRWCKSCSECPEKQGIYGGHILPILSFLKEAGYPI